MVLMSNELFEMIKNKKVGIDIGSRIPLAEAAKAHQQLESRQTTGATILLV